MIRIVLLAAVALLLAGCAADGLKGSVAGSCAVFERPPYAVAGKTQYDQDVADKFVESGVAGCNWARPAARPPELDSMPAVKPAPAAPARRKGVVARVRHKVAAGVARITGRPAQAAPAPSQPTFPAGPVEPVEVTPAAPVPPPAPAPPPRSRIEQLLRPNG